MTPFRLTGEAFEVLGRGTILLAEWKDGDPTDQQLSTLLNTVVETPRGKFRIIGVECSRILTAPTRISRRLSFVVRKEEPTTNASPSHTPQHS